MSGVRRIDRWQNYFPLIAHKTTSLFLISKNKACYYILCILKQKINNIDLLYTLAIRRNIVHYDDKLGVMLYNKS